MARFCAGVSRALRSWSRSHTGLSAMPRRMKTASTAGTTPTKNSARQPKCGTSSALAADAAKKPNS